MVLPHTLLSGNTVLKKLKSKLSDLIYPIYLLKKTANNLFISFIYLFNISMNLYDYLFF